MKHAIEVSDDAIFPAWVEMEIDNWVRAQWEGEWPGPAKIARLPTVCSWPPKPGEFDHDAPIRVIVNEERAGRVDAIYQALPFTEQRVVQEEYTRVLDYHGLPNHLRHVSASRKLDISVLYFKMALDSFKRQVWEEFDE